MSFWTQQTRYGVFHQADKNQARYRPDVLVVFVHGLFGDPLDTWKDTPLWLSERVGENIDILNFSYASGLWQKTSIQQAADDLRTCLESTYSHYQFFIFITHSTGGLVVKALLNRCAQSVLTQGTKPDFSTPESVSLWFKTRRVINFAVPHSGGDPSMTNTGQVVYKYAYFIADPFLKLVRLLTQGASDVGKNHIIEQLKHNNPYLVEMQAQYDEHQQRSAEQYLPHPTSFDLIAGSDVAVPTSEQTTQKVIFRGNHETVKIPSHPEGPIMNILVSHVERFTGDNYYNLCLAQSNFRRMYQINHELKTQHLIGKAIDEKNHHGNQLNVFDSLYQRLNNLQRFPRQLLLTGPAGAGKSTIMRHLVWRLSTDYLQAPSRQTLVPILLPLQILSGKEIDTALSWDSLWEWHEDWNYDLFPNHGFQSTKAAGNFNQQAVCLIFDGLDEFLALHQSVSSTLMLNIFNDAQQRFKHNPQFSILTISRSSVPNVERFASSLNDMYSLDTLTLEEAKSTFPICCNWLHHVEQSGSLDFALTPLVLSAIDDISDLGTQSINTSFILGQSIDSILRKSRLEGARMVDGTTIYREHLLTALMLIAWGYFKNTMGEMSLNRMRNEARLVANEWQDYLLSQNLQEEHVILANSLKLLDSDFFISGLVQRTLFNAPNNNKIRFSNRQWQDYLIALYFKLCLTLGNVSGFGERAFNPTIYKLTGELMTDEMITEQMSQSALEIWRKTKNSSIIGNILAFISWTTVPIEPAAVRQFLNEAANYSEITRIVLLASFGYRGLGIGPNDRSSKDIRNALLPLLQTASHCESCPIGDRITSSLAWCYLKTYSDAFNLEMPDTPWPDLRSNEDGQRIALGAVCQQVNGQFQLDKYTKSLQLAFLSAINQTEDNPHLLIRSMHYLYFLVIAKKFGAHVVELNDGLDALLSDNSVLFKLVYADDALPEMKLMFDYFKTLNDGG